MSGDTASGSRLGAASALRMLRVTGDVRMGDVVPHRPRTISAIVRHGPTPDAPQVALWHVLESSAQPLTFPGSAYHVGTDQDAGVAPARVAASTCDSPFGAPRPHPAKTPSAATTAIATPSHARCIRGPRW